MLMRNSRIMIVAVLLAIMSGLSPMGAFGREQPVLTLGRPVALADYGGSKIFLIDEKGSIIWQHNARHPQDVWVLKNGNILYSHVKGAVEITRDKKVVWEFKTEGRNEVHACQPLPDGKVMVAESGPMRIIEVDRDGKITKEVKLTTKCRNTHGQMRCVRKTPKGTYTVGQYHDNVMREYDETGKIIMEVSQKQCFSGIRLPNGNTLMATGDDHRIVEFDKDKNIVWEVTEKDLPGNPLRFIAGMQRLPNGNTLVCNWGGHGHVGKQPQVFEVTPEKKVVGEIYDFKQFGTISGIYDMTVKGDSTKFEITR